MRRAYIIIAALTSIIRPAFAQDNCADVLKGGIWEYRSAAGSEQQASSFLTWFCSKEFKSQQEATDAGLSISLPIEGIPISVGGKYKETQWSEYRNEACSYSSGQYKHASEFSAFSRTASQAVVNAWEKCINRIGTTAWVSTTDDPKTFALQIRRVTDIGPPKFTVGGVQVTPNSVKCSPSLSSAKGKTFTGSVSFLCQRSSIKDSVTLLPTVNGIQPPLPLLSFAGYRDLPPGVPPLPITTKLFSSTSGIAAHPEAEVRVDAGYKVIGCGGRANWNEPGNLLTAVYPNSANQSCVAKAKDHVQSSPATLTVWAIGLFDPQDQWEVSVFSTSSPGAAHPRADVSVPPGYVMTGGGAQANYAGAGSLLTASYPLAYDTWQGRAKDHEYSDPSSLTVYAIGIRPRDKATPMPRIRSFAQTSAAAAHPSQAVHLNPPEGFVITSGGALVDWRGAGNLLTATYPTEDGTGWMAAAKDHDISDPAPITVWLLAIEKLP